MKIDFAKVDHFLDFITSPHIVQDMPFGEKMLKLSTWEVIKTPKGPVIIYVQGGEGGVGGIFFVSA